ncbi:MAG TPA: 50S ribosomal protein L22 [Candidatus Diapherotrites archaeon]|uniref:50S ribosomal protein L22 n=1 Tax=Candidatus Iainarchaeum sp. TaxID=3101447 RepID=A0A7J4IXD8_9ARCH|nr:50S ribosomal protein L22P [uncultured archaeon]HIH10223.1 50S ribosomal protein L22 [Candidatus Diapherotrites archaeon]
MVKKAYQVAQVQRKGTASAMMKNKPVSLKYSVEIISNIKGMRVDKAIEYLKRILSMEEYLPLRKYNRKIGHKKGEAKGFTKVGKYPLRCVGAFIELLENVKANADYKGLDSDNLIITHMFASQGFARRSNQAQGRISGKARKRKSAHIEIVVREAR